MIFHEVISKFEQIPVFLLKKKLRAIQSKHEENLNALTHGFGILLSIIGTLVLLLNYNPKTVDVFYVLVYGLSLVILYTASTLYHIAIQDSYKKLLRKFDHISIYVLISGTYTPVCVSILKDSNGFLILGLVWGLTMMGLILKLFFTGKFEKISLLLYLIMGWLIVIDIKTFYTAVDAIVLWFLILGGVFYTIGILFYVMHKLKYHHVIWHVFVLFGSFFHYLMIFYILV